MKKGIKILVTGVGGPAGKATSKFFMEKGFFVLGTDMRIAETNVSLFKQVLPALDPNYSENILSLIRDYSINLLIPTVTEELVIISSLKEIIKKLGCLVFIPSKKYTIIANDKFLTSQFLKEHHITSPKTVLGSKISSTKELIKLLNFPILSKPRYGRGARGVKIYFSVNDLKKENSKEEIVYQEFIPGQEYNANLFAFPSGKTLINIILKKTALEYGIIGNAISVERTNSEIIADIADKACKAMQLEGPIDMDIRLNKDNIPVILEINARVGANVLSAPEVLEKLLETFDNTLIKNRR